jgi:O-antigen biosynthesis protein WbqP
MTVASTIPRGADAARRAMRPKRWFDVALALVLLPFVVLVCVFFGIVIRLTSPGPAIFRQTRVGRREQRFTCLKLRTMRHGTVDAPSHEVGTSTVTGVGRFLRRSKLDELPQVWNIFRGDMSFVGPRPCLPAQTALIEARRFYGLEELRPGITGISQIAGVDMQDPARLARLDASYLGDMSLPADLRLLVRTVLGAGRGDRTDAAR